MKPELITLNSSIAGTISVFKRSKEYFVTYEPSTLFAARNFTRRHYTWNLSADVSRNVTELKQIFINGFNNGPYTFKVID